MSKYHFAEWLRSGMNVSAVGTVRMCVALQVHPVLTWISGNVQIKNSIREEEIGYLVRHRNCEHFSPGARQDNTI